MQLGQGFCYVSVNRIDTSGLSLPWQLLDGRPRKRLYLLGTNIASHTIYATRALNLIVDGGNINHPGTPTRVL